MTDSRRGRATPTSVMEVGAEAGTESFIRRAGRQFIIATYGAMRVIRLYPPENEAVRNALNDLVTAARALWEHDEELELGPRASSSS